MSGQGELSLDTLNYAVENGIIDLTDVTERVEMTKRERFLKNHPYRIWFSDSTGYWYTYLPKGKKRIQKRRKDRKDLEDAIVQYYKEQAGSPTMREVFTEWNDRRYELGKIEASTHYRNDHIFNRFYGDFGNERICNVTESIICDFLEEQIGKHHLKHKAFANLKSITKGFLKRAKKLKLIKWNVTATLEDLDVSDREFASDYKEDYEEIFNEYEQEAIERQIMENQDVINLGILLIFATGIRVGELTTLKHYDFVADDAFHVRRTESIIEEDGVKHLYVKDRPKTLAGNRTVVIPSKYVWVAQKLIHENPFSEYLLVQDGRRVTSQRIRRRLKKLCDNAGVYPKSPHKIRKTYGTVLLDNKVDQRFILDQMGHISISTTEDHYHRNRKTINRKQEILDNLPEFMA